MWRGAGFRALLISMRSCFRNRWMAADFFTAPAIANLISPFDQATSSVRLSDQQLPHHGGRWLGLMLPCLGATRNGSWR